VELEAENTPPNRSWTPVVPVPSETVAVAMFQWKRLPISRGVIMRYLAYALAIVIACTALAYGIGKTGAKSYGARTEIYYPLNAQLAAGSFLREDRNLTTQLVAMKSHAILDPIAAKYNLSFDSLTKKEVVSVLQDSEVIRIEVDDRSPAHAQAIVTDIAKAYLKTQPDPDLTAENFLNTQISSINHQLGTLTSQFNDLEQRRQASATLTNPNPAESPAELQVQSQIASLNNQLTTLEGRLDTVTVDQLSEPHVSQQTQPYLLSGPVAPKPLRVAAAGALAGIMLAAIALAFLLRRLLKRQPLDQLD
jgi:capsular polysaccharide biosynthesis protein